MQSNKIIGAILLAVLIAMIAGFVTEQAFHHEMPEETAYQPDMSGFASAEAEAEPEDQVLPPVLGMLASADVEDGQKQTRACVTCHTFDQGGANRTGPNLWGIIGASKAHAEGFAYSDAMASAEGDWTYEALNGYLANPKEYLPGNKMNYAGMKDVEDRANLIAWLRTLDANPMPLPSQDEIDAVMAERYGMDEEATEQVAEDMPANDMSGDAAEDAAE